jgi:hypothetical protein
MVRDAPYQDEKLNASNEHSVKIGRASAGSPSFTIVDGLRASAHPMNYIVFSGLLFIKLFSVARHKQPSNRCNIALFIELTVLITHSRHQIFCFIGNITIAKH